MLWKGEFLHYGSSEDRNECNLHRSLAFRRVGRTFSLSSGVTREAKSSGNSKSSVPAQLSPVTLFSAWARVVWVVNCELLLSWQEKENIRNL